MAASESGIAALPSLGDLRPRTVTDQIFDLLYERVVNLSLMPGAKLSEAEVAAQMGVSRQPVRDAFYRLSQLGFIQIRPQRATTVTPLSEAAVLRAYFIRSALEEACLRKAAERLTRRDLDALGRLIAAQEKAVAADARAEFHALDDQFHHDICEYAGLEFVWTLVKENKGHMDRARYLSLSYGAATALAEHRLILDALRARDAEAAVAAIRQHLSRIEDIIARLHVDQPEVFGD
ncbi:GntR family transcriptional regulator [Amaricoccus solimangrovi]|uniref:GntR family transcriptional regulator n=1 Tax=Amaricoccus solimangrovi TaxID=2589815 RepID=A0A501WNC7_9RHOB|nr:GntR family transcriptional regulator [Amaricoccus solimangrovi]TPE50939.1 GntR family transcriptional regulator [Amaricoccus solimangrovi]